MVNIVESNVSMEFRQYVDITLKNGLMGDEVLPRLWGKTPFGQNFSLVCSKLLWYSVRLIVDEDHRDLKISREKGVHTSDVLVCKQFLSIDTAKEYVNKMHSELTVGIFPKSIPFRIRILPADCIAHPDKYLKPGDHIQRYLGAIIPLGNHEGVYLGNGKVAHINPENCAVDGVGVLQEKKEACARIDEMGRFVTSNDQEIRIIVHCLRRRSRENICETAKRLAKEKYRSGEYNLFQKNCQHFAAYCVIGEEWMSDKDDLTKKGFIGASVLMIAGSIAYAFFTRNESFYSEEHIKNGKTERR